MAYPLRKLLILSPLLLLAGPAEQAAALCAETPSNLTGRWKGNDGGNYDIRLLGTGVFWAGTSPDGGRSWVNVFHGTRSSGGAVKGTWADVAGGARGWGTLELRIVNKELIVRTNHANGFGGSRWTRGGCIDNEAVPEE